MKQAVWAVLMLLTALIPSAAFAHASLIGSDPPDGALVMHAPATVTLTFNEPVSPLTIRMVDASGTATAITDIRRDGAQIILTPPLISGEGARVVSWRVMSADGHPVGGSLTYWIGQRGNVAALTVRSDDKVLRGAIWLARIVIYLGLFVGAGGAFFTAWIGPHDTAAMRRIGVGVSVAGLVALVLSVGLQGLDALGLPLPALSNEDAWMIGARGSFGHAVGFAAAALLLALLSFCFLSPPRRTMALLALIGTGLALAATGHAASAQPTFLTKPAVFLHGVSLAFWLGALLPLAFAMRDPSVQAAGILVRFSRTIPFAVAALLVSGVLLATVQLERLDALWTTDYGRVLAIKLALVAPLLLLALWNRLWLTPRTGHDRRARRLMRRSIVVELALVVAILGVVGLWRFTSPPRALVAVNDDFFTHVHAERAMADVTLSPGHAGPIRITIQLRTPDERLLDAKGLSVTLSNPAAGIEPSTAEAQPAGEGQWRVAMAAPVPGQWTLRLDILISDFDNLSVEAPVLIK
ncbi:MAG: CopD family protein [Rhizobiales bacterium]|nr:CopD family protein [Hyphomicrobiales bacterium]